MSLEGLKTYSDHLMGYTVYMTDGKRQCPAFAQLPQSCLLAMVWIRDKPVCIIMCNPSDTSTSQKSAAVIHCSLWVAMIMSTVCINNKWIASMCQYTAHKYSHTMGSLRTVYHLATQLQPTSSHRFGWGQDYCAVVIPPNTPTTTISYDYTSHMHLSVSLRPA